MSLRASLRTSVEGRDERSSLQPTVLLSGSKEATWREQLLSKLEINHAETAEVSMEKQQQDEEPVKRDYNLFVITPKHKGFYAFAELTTAAIQNPGNTVVTLLEDDDSVVYTEVEQHELVKIREMLQQRGVQMFDNLEDTSAFLNSKKV